jgi:chemotaxis signal transduction protein
VLTMEWLAFKAGDEYLGIEAQYIHRVVDEVKVTPVPLVPSCYIGLIYYRGEMFDVIDIGSLLGQREVVAPPASPEQAGKENSRIILVKWSHKKLALVPDKIIGLIWVEDTEERHTVYAPSPPGLSPDERDNAGQEEEYTVRLITPDHIWEKVSELSYGPHKV